MTKYKYDIAFSYAGEDSEIAETVFHYLCANGLKVFFAPFCQPELVGYNGDEIFYRVFAQNARFVALFVSKDYVGKRVPMQEASICLANHKSSEVLPIYLDGTALPIISKKVNYLVSHDAALIAKFICNRLASSASEGHAHANDVEEHAPSAGEGRSPAGNGSRRPRPPHRPTKNWPPRVGNCVSVVSNGDNAQIAHSIVNNYGSERQT